MKSFSKLLALSVALLIAVPGMVSAEEKRIGQDEFMKNCAACHGPVGKGDGPFVEFLQQSPKDLSLLTKNHNGMFPFQKVYDWIEDSGQIRAHGTIEMPVWGDRYREEMRPQYDPFGAGFNQTVRARILELVFYIASIQQ